MVGVIWEQLPASYDAVASEYEATFLDELDDKPQDREMLRHFIEAATDPIVDLGCGPGQVGRFVRDHDRAVVGVDISAAMTRLAFTRLDGAVVSDIRRLPFAGGSLGGVVAFYSLIHLPREDLNGALTETYRVLRPGGQLLLSAHEGRGILTQEAFLGHAVPFVATLFSLDELVAAIRRSGLHVTMSQRREPLESEHQTGRLYVAAERPSSISSMSNSPTRIRSEHRRRKG
jgi:SAM-dependent methyltransferase